MTILHVSDFHFNRAWYNWLLDRAPPHDLLVMSGDMLDLSAATPHRKQIAWVTDWCNDYPGALSLCSGNHDLEWDAEAERWTPAYWLRDLSNPRIWTDGQRVTLDGLSLLNIGCTTRPKGGLADIWVIHAPPTGLPVSTRLMGGDGGDRDLGPAARRYRPSLVLSGHVHDPLHWHHRDDSTLYLNPGRNAGAPFPNHILIRTEDQHCEFVAAHRPESQHTGVSLPACTTDRAPAHAVA